MRDPSTSLDGKLRLFAFQRTTMGATLAIRVNGSEVVSGPVPAVDVTTALPVHLGAFSSTFSSPQFMTGAIGEVVIVKGTVTSQDRSALETYLTTKWKLP